MKRKSVRGKRFTKSAGKQRPGPVENVIVRRSRKVLFVGDGVERMRQLEQRCYRLEEVARFYATTSKHDGGKRAVKGLKDAEAA